MIRLRGIKAIDGTRPGEKQLILYAQSQILHFFRRITNAIIPAASGNNVSLHGRLYLSLFRLKLTVLM